MPEGPLGGPRPGAQSEIEVSVLIEGLDEPINTAPIERQFREKGINPRVDVGLDSGVISRQRVIWHTRSDDISLLQLDTFLQAVVDNIDERELPEGIRPLDRETIRHITTIEAK